MARTVGMGIGAATLLGSTIAFAADLPPPPFIAAPIAIVESAPTLAGYIELRGGLVTGNQPFENPGGAIDWRNVLVGGAGRIAVTTGSRLTLQLDIWGDYLIDVLPEPEVGPFSIGTEDGPDWHGGVGTHVVFGSTDGFRFGALASVGINTDANENTRGPADGLFANFGGGASAVVGNFRVTGQGGFTLGVRGNTAASHDRGIYADIGAAFYPTPNLGISAHVGWDRFWSDFYLNQTLSYGGRVEFKLGSTPLSIFAAYEGSRSRGGWVTDFDETWIGTEHVIVGGIRRLLGRETLQDLDNAVPFADRNPIYGDPFAAH